MKHDVELEVLWLKALGQRSRRDMALAEALEDLLFDFEPCDKCGNQNQNCICPPGPVVFCKGFESGTLTR